MTGPLIPLLGTNRGGPCRIYYPVMPCFPFLALSSPLPLRRLDNRLVPASQPTQHGMVSNLPLFEEAGPGKRPSLDFYRLRWYISGPSTGTNVLASPTDSTSSQSPYQSALDCFHPISESPVSYPAVSSIKVTVGPLEDWTDDWDDEHNGCHGDVKELVTLTDGTEQVVGCCGEARPGPGPPSL